MSFADALAAPPAAAFLADLPGPNAALIRELRVGGQYILMDCMGPGETLGTLSIIV
jgi:hypothetical protein